MKTFCARPIRPFIQAFSLVELVLAIGIVSFAMVSIMGLIPLGLGTFREARNLSVETSIAQGLIADVQLTDLKKGDPVAGAPGPFYFDAQGTEVNQADSVITATIEPPAPVAAGEILVSEAQEAVRTIIVRINHRATPGVDRLYPVIVPLKP